jgi:hypothetical protein
MTIPEELRRRLIAAHQEALRVGDSPLRADQLAAKVADLTRAVAAAEVPGDARGRTLAALADAERVLRRDDDGNEAAKHLQTALRQLEGGGPPRKPSPFLDD